MRRNNNYAKGENITGCQFHNLGVSPLVLFTQLKTGFLKFYVRVDGDDRDSQKRPSNKNLITKLNYAIPRISCIVIFCIPVFALGLEHFLTGIDLLIFLYPHLLQKTYYLQKLTQSPELLNSY